MARIRSVRKTARLIVTIEFLLKAQVTARCCRPRSRIGAIDHPLSTLTESEIKVRDAQATGQRLLIWRGLSL
jgi:hypothetical protein